MCSVVNAFFSAGIFPANNCDYKSRDRTRKNVESSLNRLQRRRFTTIHTEGENTDFLLKISLDL